MNIIKRLAKRSLSILAVLSLLLMMSSCDRYTSSYNAIGLVRMQDSHSCEVSFYSLNGQIVFKLKKSDLGTEGDISYSLSVDEGEVRLYYDAYGTKEELSHVKNGESEESSGGYVEGGNTVYIIIEAADASNGKIAVELDN